MSRQTALFAMAAVLLAATAARSYGIADRTLSFDESFSWRLITQNSVSGIIQKTAADVHPPLYYLLLKGWERVCGDSLLALRMPSLLLGIVSLILVYLLARDVHRAVAESPDDSGARASGLIGMALVGSAGAHVRWSGEARMYTLSCVLAALSTWILVATVYRPEHARRTDWMRWPAYTLSVAAMLYTHYYLMFVVAAQALWLFGIGFPPSSSARAEVRTAARRGCFALAVGVLGFAPWLPTLMRQTDQVRSGYWIHMSSSFDAVKGWADLIVPRNRLDWGDDWTALGIVGLSAVIPVWLAWSGRRAEILLALLILVPTCVPIALTIFGIPIVDERTSRYWLVELVFLGVVGAVLISRYFRSGERWLVAAVLVANNAYWSAEFARETHIDLMTGVRGAVEYVQTHDESPNAIIVRDPNRYFSVKYFLRHERRLSDKVRLLPRVALTHFNGGPLIREGDLCHEAQLRGEGDRVWVLDGSSLFVVLEHASLPEPWRPVGESRVFAEPFVRNGKVVVTQQVYDAD